MHNVNIMLLLYVLLFLHFSVVLLLLYSDQNLEIDSNHIGERENLMAVCGVRTSNAIPLYSGYLNEAVSPKNFPLFA